MKYNIIITCLLFVILHTQCKKDNTNINDIPGLPPATQIGANTFGCLVNGAVFKPTTRNDLSLDLDLGFKNGIFGIVAYKGVGSLEGAISLGIIDSLRFLKSPFSKEIRLGKIGYISYTNNFGCFTASTDSLVFVKGNLLVSKLDTSVKIISGEFSSVLFNKACGDTIRITNGRFDIKF